MNKFSEQNKLEIEERYTNRYLKYGYDPKTLGWDKGKQMSRYYTLLSGFNLEGKKILDIGCGFGDGLKVIRSITSNFEYLGVDIVKCLIDEARVNNSGKNVKFVCADFLDIEVLESYDIIIGSGIFNFKLIDQDNYEFIRNVITRSYSLCTEGIAFDFLSNRVSYELDNTFHSDPPLILNEFYKLTNRVELTNSIMPFEFSVKAFKKDDFKSEDTLFSEYKDTQVYRNCCRIEQNG